MATQFKPLDENGLLFLWQQMIANFVKHEAGKGLSSNDLTDELVTKINDAVTNAVTDYSELTGLPRINGVELVGNTALETLGIKKSIEDALGDFTNISHKFVNNLSELPSEGKTGTFYLIPNSGEENNSYDEYIWDDEHEKYELLGSIQKEINLTDYIKREDITPLTNDEILNIINTTTS